MYKSKFNSNNKGKNDYNKGKYNKKRFNAYQSNSNSSNYRRLMSNDSSIVAAPIANLACPVQFLY